MVNFITYFINENNNEDNDTYIDCDFDEVSLISTELYDDANDTDSGQEEYSVEKDEEDSEDDEESEDEEDSEDSEDEEESEDEEDSEDEEEELIESFIWQIQILREEMIRNESLNLLNTVNFSEDDFETTINDFESYADLD